PSLWRGFPVGPGPFGPGRPRPSRVREPAGDRITPWRVRVGGGRTGVGARSRPPGQRAVPRRGVRPWTVPHRRLSLHYLRQPRLARHRPAARPAWAGWLHVRPPRAGPADQLPALGPLRV